VQLAKTHPGNADDGLIERRVVLLDAQMLGVGMSCGGYENAPSRGANLSDANLAHARLGVADRGGGDSPSLSQGADFSRASGLTHAKDSAVCGAAITKLPVALRVKTCT
jgi:hypothetical protein